MQKSAQRVANLVQHAGLQLAVRAGDDAVSAPGVKADAGHAVLVYAHRELHLVAVAVYLRGRQDVQHWHLQPADAAEGIQHAFLFGAQLSGIIQMPQAAPAAGACYRAVNRNAVRRGGEQLVQNAKGIPAAVLHDAHPCFVPGGGAGDKYGLAIGTVGHTAASLERRSMRRVRIWFFCKGMVSPCVMGSGYSWAGLAGSASCWAAKYLLGGTPLARLNTREK